MRCSICRERLKETPVQTNVLRSKQWKLHGNCLKRSMIFDFKTYSGSQMAAVCQEQGLETSDVFPEFVEMKTRLGCMLDEKEGKLLYKWKLKEGVSLTKSAPPAGLGVKSLLKKRNFDQMISKREREFNLDVYNLVSMVYGLTHPSLAFFKKIEQRMVQIPPQRELTAKMISIHEFLNQVTSQRCQNPNIGGQLLSFLKKQSHWQNRASVKLEKPKFVGESNYCLYPCVSYL